MVIGRNPPFEPAKEWRPRSNELWLGLFRVPQGRKCTAAFNFVKFRLFASATLIAHSMAFNLRSTLKRVRLSVRIDNGRQIIKVGPVNIALTKDFEEMILRLVSSGRYQNSGEVVRAGLRLLEAEETALTSPTFPPGALAHLYSSSANQAERLTARASSLQVEVE
jgi:antitoxin ParD1/3/4